jgi:hypothetical protein
MTTDTRSRRWSGGVLDTKDEVLLSQEYGGELEW